MVVTMVVLGVTMVVLGVSMVVLAMLVVTMVVLVMLGVTKLRLTSARLSTEWGVPPPASLSLALAPSTVELPVGPGTGGEHDLGGQVRPGPG